MKWISTATLFVVLGFGVSGNRILAQQAADAPVSDEIHARLDQQDTEIRALREQLSAMQQQQAPVIVPAPAGPDAAVAVPAPATPDGAPAGAAAAPAQPANPPQPYQVGSDLSGITFFMNGQFLNFSTPHKDFTMHLGGWVQWDNVWWNQADALLVNQGKAGHQAGIASGAAPGGMNYNPSGAASVPLEDGEYWRRLRIVQEGTFWETGEYRFNWALENIQFATGGLDEMWVGQNYIPVIGSVRVGHVKNAMGLEADMTSSSRAMTFLERSSYSEAIELNQNFVTGLWLGNSYLDDRVTYQAVLARPDTGTTGDFFGTGQTVVQGRLTCLPLYTDEGRQLLHLGISAGWRNGTRNLDTTGFTGNTVILQARPEQRDDDPAAVPGAIPNSNDARMISTGLLACDNEYLMGLELAYVRGPVGLQAEYGWNWLNNASGIISATALTTPRDYVFSGGYVMLTYTLTGESRSYDKKAGAFSRYYFGTSGPYENAYLVRDENGGVAWGKGAWELAFRYSHTDLNSGAGTTAINGGLMDGLGVALNWYCNINLTANFEWIWNNRYDLPGATIPGEVNVFATRVQYSF